MKTIYLDISLNENDLAFIQKMFPEEVFIENDPHRVSKVNVLVSNQANLALMEQMPKLQWLHLLTPYISDADWGSLKERELHITNTRAKNETHIGELALAGTLALGHQLIFCPLATPNWSLKNKSVLVVGLGLLGSHLAKIYREMGCLVYGVHTHETFHPQCENVTRYEDIEKALPKADITCLSLPRGVVKKNWFDEIKLSLLKKDSLLVATGSLNTLDYSALNKILYKKQLLGCVAIAHDTPLCGSSPLALSPRCLYFSHKEPFSDENGQSLHTFRSNLRRFLVGRPEEMENRVQ